MVAIRLRREGNKNRPFYRIVAIPHNKKRDGGFLESPPAQCLRSSRLRPGQKEQGYRRLAETVGSNPPVLHDTLKKN